jgi:outer membrane protein assembly factor BamB
MKHKLLKLFAGLILLLGLCWGIMYLYRVYKVLYVISRPSTVFPLKLKWQIELGSSTYERPAYQDGLVLFPANGSVSSHWYGLEATTGQVIWSQRVRRNSFLRCLTSEYLVVSGQASLVILKTRSGKIVWTGERAHTATCSEEVLFYSGVPRDSVGAINLSSGQWLWGGTTPFKSFNGLVYNPEAEELIAKETTLPGDMYIIEVGSGQLKHSFDKVVYAPEDGGKRGPMYLIDRRELFIGGTVQDAQTGEVIHKEDRYSTNFPPTVTENMMYLSSGYEVVAFDRADYNIKWIYSPERSAHTTSPVAILDGIGYVIYSDVTLRATDLETGQLLGYWQPEVGDLLSWSVHGTIPTGVGMAASEDTLFVSFGDGKLYAFGE